MQAVANTCNFIAFYFNISVVLHIHGYMFKILYLFFNMIAFIFVLPVYKSRRDDYILWQPTVQEEGSKSRELETPPPSASKGPLRTTADILSLLKKPQNTQTNSQNGTSSNLESGTTVAKYPLSETNRYRTSGLSSSFKSVGHKPGLASKGGSVAQGSTENQQPQETRWGEWVFHASVSLAYFFLVEIIKFDMVHLDLNWTDSWKFSGVYELR